MIRRIDLGQNLRHVFWTEDGLKVVLALEESFYLLDFNSEKVDEIIAQGTPEDAEDGYEEAFTFVEEYSESITSAQWISSNCFTFINNRGNINYVIGNKVIKLGNADKKQHILGYDGK